MWGRERLKVEERREGREWGGRGEGDKREKGRESRGKGEGEKRRRGGRGDGEERERRRRGEGEEKDYKGLQRKDQATTDPGVLTRLLG